MAYIYGSFVRKEQCDVVVCLGRLETVHKSASLISQLITLSKWVVFFVNACGYFLQFIWFEEKLVLKTLEI